jgi:hypothetical protein
VQWIFLNHALTPMLIEWARARGEHPSRGGGPPRAEARRRSRRPHAHPGRLQRRRGGSRLRAERARARVARGRRGPVTGPVARAARSRGQPPAGSPSPRRLVSPP